MGVSDNSAFSALVVDDDGEVWRLLTRALVANGIQVDSAPNGLIASELLRQRTYGVGLEPQAERILKVASLLHEIGQFGMPDTLRDKAAWRLPKDIREQYEKCPAIGAALLGEMPGTDEIVRLVECHAENFDGSGFPNKLSGDAIPIGARIIRLADAYDTYLMFAFADKGLYRAKSEGRNRVIFACD